MGHVLVAAGKSTSYVAPTKRDHYAQHCRNVDRFADTGVRSKRREYLMKKFVSRVAALVLFGSFAATSGAFASTQDGAEVARNVDGQTVEGLGISEEERERRVLVCERPHETCRDWCTATRGGQECYKDCSKANAACMKKIPYVGQDEE